MAKSILPAVHPGEVLKIEYLDELGWSPGTLAKRIDVPRTRIERLVRGETAITPDTALRLAKFFRTSAEFWMNMQLSYDLKTLELEMAADLEKIAEYEPKPIAA
jgi:antitoxin HigA-1